MFKIMNGRESFYQWDLNQKLIVEDASITEVHFCNKTDDCSLVVEVYEENGLRLANVPNILLQDNWDIRAYAYCGECYTKQCDRFKVIARTKPADYIYEETEIKNLEHLEQRVEEIESIAKGAVAGKSFISVEHLIDTLNNAHWEDFAPAQHLLIATLGVPDVWIYEVSSNHLGYGYTDDETFINDINAGLVQIGFYVLSPLETQKVDLADYVKNTDYGSKDKAGVVKIDPTYGFQIDQKHGVLATVYADENTIKTKTAKFKPITPVNLDYAVKVGITTNTKTLTDDEKKAACEWLGAQSTNQEFKLIETISLSEAGNLQRTLNNYDEIIIDIAYSQKGAGTNVITTNIGEYSHSIGANDSYSVYRISRKNGVYNIQACTGAYRGLVTTAYINNEVILTDKKLTSIHLSRGSGFPIGTTFKIYALLGGAN